MLSILDSYNVTLPAFCLKADEEGYISLVKPTGATSPATVEDKRLVLPTDAWLRKGFGEDLQPFHPLAESLSRRGTSPVIQYLQRSAKANISLIVHMMAEQLLQIAADKSSHKDLPPDSTDFLKKLSDADKSTVGLLEKLLASASKKNRLCSVYLKNGGTIDGKKVNRSAIIRFPILEDLQAEAEDVLGVKMAKKHRKVLVALFKMIVPFGDNPEEYAAGTTSRVAPYYTSLLQAYHKVGVVLNQVIYRYGIPLQIPVKPIELYDLSIIDDFSKIYNMVPPLNGNLGGKDEDVPEEVVAQPQQVAQLTQQQAPVVTTPQMQRSAPVVTAPTVKTNTVSMAEFMAATQPQQQQVVMQQQPMQMGYMQQPMMQQQPMQMGMMQQPMQMGGNPYAPVSTITPSWQAQPQMGMNNMQPANPYMQAVSGMSGGNGLGLV